MTRLRHKTKARAKIDRKATKPRAELIARVGQCECCGHGPNNPRPDMAWQMSKLCVHEILNAGFRKKAQAAPFAVLVACFFCNQYELHNRVKWPRERQLAALHRSREKDYDLSAFLKMWDRGPNAITQEEVDAWL